MKKYLIKKGSVVYLFVLNDFDHLSAPLGAYDTIISERDVIFTEDDRIEYPRNVVHPAYYYFILPKNDRGYDALAVIPSIVEIVEE